MSKNKRPRHYPTDSNDEPPTKKAKRDNEKEKPIKNNEKKVEDENLSVYRDDDVYDSDSDGDTVKADSPIIEDGYDSWG